MPGGFSEIKHLEEFQKQWKDFVKKNLREIFARILSEMFEGISKEILEKNSVKIFERSLKRIWEGISGKISRGNF